jgi:hypothetical protein
VSTAITTGPTGVEMNAGHRRRGHANCLRYDQGTDKAIEIQIFLLEDRWEERDYHRD